MTPISTSLAHALDLADVRHWTRQPPKRPAARLRHLLRTQDTAALAPRLFAYPEALTRWAQGDTSTLSPAQALLIEREIYRTWQADVRRRAHQRILDQLGCVAVQLHARFTYTTTHGEFDDPRLRRLTSPFQLGRLSWADCGGPWLSAGGHAWGPALGSGAPGSSGCGWAKAVPLVRWLVLAGPRGRRKRSPAHGTRARWPRSAGGGGGLHG